MLRLTSIVGCASDPAIAERLHHVEHHGGVESVRLSRQDMARRRQHLHTDKGTEVALLLDRDAVLENGSVLLLEHHRAVLVVLDEPQWLVVRAADAASALELGYFAGNMHWKVRFDGARLCIALEGPRESYLLRLDHLLQQHGLQVEPAPEAAAPHAH